MAKNISSYYYERYAYLASKAERVNDYALAGELWLKAYDFCFRDVDTEWVSRRLAFCRHCLLRNGDFFGK
ncbi:ANR family transcriptional regulator [Escherichia coli]|uniref:ANR family transcriptional regulator n=1 Tax=Escherichia coli TaxID=562 RepID=UPI000F0B0FC6|nr:ANR family transcriptional regulator [Escherichia coli]EJE8511729.1 ANR family transcriptional regulator [Shigella sonnei]ELO0577282.1 ANR family transcriptional regulator [Escherichia coli O2]EER1954245.1 ANR family transcriptional regulator [Escherichia coli]EES3420434.1 ANR family transcriptional regulator [Escherichia coli]